MVELIPAAAAGGQVQRVERITMQVVGAVRVDIVKQLFLTQVLNTLEALEPGEQKAARVLLELETAVTAVPVYVKFGFTINRGKIWKVYSRLK